MLKIRRMVLATFPICGIAHSGPRQKRGVARSSFALKACVGARNGAL